MRQHVVVPNAEAQMKAISDFIATRNLPRSRDYIDVAIGSFFDLPENRLPVRASENLPKDVRKVSVPGFRGYTLRVLYRGEYIALVAAFRPGLTVDMQDDATHPGLDEFSRDYGPDA